MTNARRTMIKQLSFNKTINGVPIDTTKEIPMLEGDEHLDQLRKIVYEAKEQVFRQNKEIINL